MKDRISAFIRYYDGPLFALVYVVVAFMVARIIEGFQ